MRVVRELYGLLFGRLLPREGALAVLTAYYDDSGTHEGAKVLLMGGAIGNEEQWTAFEAGWAKFLAEPTRGKGPLKRFHAYDCEHHINEFDGWNQADSDNAIYNARSVLLSAGLRGYAAGIETEPWDELVTGPLRIIFGDAERYAVIQCVMKTIALALSLGEKQIKFVFDNRPDRNEANRRIHDLFQFFGRLDAEHPEIRDVAFLGSTGCTPLQAADMVAYEYFRAMGEFTQNPGPKQFRAHWRRLEESGNFMGEMFTRKNVQDMAERLMPGLLQMKQHELEMMKVLLWGY